MEKIQELTEKILREGVEKGQAEADRIIQEAKQQAEKILQEARQQAQDPLHALLRYRDKIVHQGKRDEAARAYREPTQNGVLL